MKLMYLDYEAIDDMKNNFDSYRDHFCDETNQWFMDKFRENNWIHESNIECEDFELDKNEDFNTSDRKNVEIVYEHLKTLKPSYAQDERLWAGMLFAHFWDYVQYRRGKELASGSEQDIKNSFFFMRSIRRSCFVNCLSRLWWTGHILYDDNSDNHYSAVDIIAEKAYASTVMLFSSNNFTSNKDLALGVIDCIGERKRKGEKIGRYHFVEANRYLNAIGGITLLDMLTREEVKEYANKILNEKYGVL